MEGEQRRHSHRETERQRQQERRERARKASERERHKKARGNDCYVFRSSATATAATARRGASASGCIICTQAGTHQKCLSEGRRDGRQSPKLLWPLVHGWRGDEGRARWARAGRRRRPRCIFRALVAAARSLPFVRHFVRSLDVRSVIERGHRKARCLNV